MSAITVSGLWKEYGRQVVLEHIDLEIESGSFVALVGPSGCGKSTFLKMILGDEVPTRGQILIDGEPLKPEPDIDRGVVFQRYSVFPHLTVLGNVLLALEISGSSFFGRLWGAARKKARAEAFDMIECVGLSAAAKKYPSELSGGMQQRLALAQALILKPKILLLDEPFGALDPGIRSDIHKLVQRLWKEEGITVLMVTHDLSEAFTLGTRVIAFDRVRKRPEETSAYGATVTFDMKVDKPVEPPSELEADLHEAQRQAAQ